MSAIFTRDGQPLKVYIDSGGGLKQNVETKLISNGASLVEERAAADVIISDTPQPSVVRPEWIDSSLIAGEILPEEPYAYVGVSETVAVAPQRSKARGHFKFTPDKDEFILERVRQEPRKRKSLEFYVELASSPELRGHTGNSVRSRFNQQLAKRLAWVYDRDLDGNYKLDEEGNRKRTTVIPDTQKVPFSHQDDFYLCERIAKEREFPDAEVTITDPTQFYQEEIEARINESKTEMMPYPFYGQLAKELPQHSQNSWRDHHRKYLSLDAVPYYIAYYKWCQEQGIPPKKLPRKKAYDSSKINANRKRAQAPEPLDQEIGQTADSDISRLHAVDVARVAAEAAEQAAQAVAAQQADEADDNVAPEEELTRDGPSPKRARRAPEEEQVSQIREDSLVPSDSQDEAEVTGLDMLTSYADEGDGHHYCYMNNASTLDEFIDFASVSGQLKDKRDRHFKELAEEIAKLEDVKQVETRLREEGFTTKFIDHILLSCSMLSPVVGRYIETTGPKLFRLAMKPGDVKVPILSYISPRDDPEFWTLARDHALVRYSFNGTDQSSHESKRRQFLIDNRGRIDPEIVPERD